MNTILLLGMPGGGELFFIVLVIIMFFGAKRIPEFARMLGKGIKELKNATNDIQREIKDSASSITDLKDKVDIKKQVNNLMKDDEVNHAPTKPEDIKSDVDESIVENINEKEEQEQEEIISNTIKRESPYKSTQPPKEENK